MNLSLKQLAIIDTEMKRVLKERIIKTETRIDIHNILNEVIKDFKIKQLQN